MIVILTIATAGWSGFTTTIGSTKFPLVVLFIIAGTAVIVMAELLSSSLIRVFVVDWLVFHNKEDQTTLDHTIISWIRGFHYVHCLAKHRSQ